MTAVLAIAVGIAGVGWILTSVIRTVVIPMPQRVWLTTTAFGTSRRVVWFISRRLSIRRRHYVRGAMAPTVAVSLPLLWSIGVVASYTAIYWGAGVGSVRECVELSGSSLTTLGFVPASGFGPRMLAISEGLIGLGLIALMISFLPTLYGTFSRREVAVGRLTTRAGSPPSPYDFTVRLNTIGRLDKVGERWEEWEDWFVELGETHTSFPALIYFRSAEPSRSWLSAAEMALDTAAVLTAAQLVPSTGQADTMIRSGYLALRSIADFYRIEPERTDWQEISLSIEQRHVNALLDKLETSGIEIAADRDDIWRAFAGWRVNYDRSIVGLRHLVGDVPSHWELLMHEGADDSGKSR